MTHKNNAQHQATRKAALQQAAERAGFATWSAMLTAIIKGQAQVIKLPQQ